MDRRADENNNKAIDLDLHIRFLWQGMARLIIQLPFAEKYKKKCLNIFLQNFLSSN